MMSVVLFAVPLRAVCAAAFFVLVAGFVSRAHAEADSRAGLFSKDNLVAWCVVPFDASQRGPEERAAMLERLGFTKLAYDWREQHIPEFEDEIRALEDRNIEFFAFWGLHEGMFALFEKHGIRPQVWLTVPHPGPGLHLEQVEAAGRQLLDAARRTQALGCAFGLYNHGGWGGEPANMVAVCEWLREETGSDHIGIVYNLHHGHGHIEDFAEHLEQMKPYLLCLNLNGMNTGEEPKILPVGQGQHDAALLRIILDSGYEGPIGIIDHRADLDAEASLRENLEGLARMLDKLAVENTEDR